MIYIQMCESCERKRNKQERKIVYRPIVSKNYNERVQVDLIDWQSVSDTGEFKHILTYIDHFTNYTQLRALPNRNMITVVDSICGVPLNRRRRPLVAGWHKNLPMNMLAYVNLHGHSVCLKLHLLACSSPSFCANWRCRRFSGTCIRDIFYMLDAPRLIQTDNGKEFKNDRMKEMLTEFGTIHIRGTPKHSQSPYVKRRDTAFLLL